MILSRNDFKKDEQYNSFLGEVRGKCKQYMKGLCKEVNKTKDKELRELLLRSFTINTRFFKDYDPEDAADSYLAALADAKIFTCWNKLGVFSLNELYQQSRETGQLVLSSNAANSELLDVQGYEGAIVRTPNHCHFRFKDIPQFDLDRLYTNSGEMIESTYLSFVESGLIDPEKLKVKIESGSTEGKTPNEQNFLNGLRSILSSERVKKVLADTGLDTDYTVAIASVSPIGVAACYNSLVNHIIVNRDNPLSAQYISEQDGNTALVYLPILAHELSHNKLTRHDNPFYDTSSELSSKLEVAIAADCIEGKHCFGK